MPGRSYTSDNYRYGFNGMEKDDEVKGAGNSLDFGARIYDPRVGRWLSIDPLQQKYPSLSPYSFVDNSPILFIDPDGKKIWINDPNTNEPVLYVPNQTQIAEGVSDFVRETAATLDEITASGMDDKFNIVKTLAEDNSYNSIIEISWDEHQSNVMGKIEWSPEGGVITNEGERQTPAEGLLHELGHTYYVLYDPTGEAANRPSEPNKAIEYDDEQSAKASDYDGSTSDKWIIEEVEGGEGGAKRKTHSYKEEYKAKAPFSTEGPAKSEIKND